MACEGVGKQIILLLSARTDVVDDEGHALLIFAVAHNHDMRQGISRQAEQLREQYGENRLREKKKKSMLARFADQFKDAMILILIAAAAVSFVIACAE